MPSERKKLPLGALEETVMEVLWADGGWLTPSEVTAKLEPSHPVAYTTVTTVLSRLSDKGRLERRRDGRAFAYRPSASRAEWSARRMREALVKGSDRTAALAHFIDRLDEPERTQLRRMLAERPKR
ncbi:MAG: BlaI/MecI/CopY family transcriptional regulator [Acidimicrobiales bacterium]|jgi:predicted transcriptional regulator